MLTDEPRYIVPADAPRRGNCIRGAARHNEESGPGEESDHVGTKSGRALEKIQKLCKSLVRKGGLEPPRFYPPDPKSGASANSATFALVVSGTRGLSFTRDRSLCVLPAFRIVCYRQRAIFQYSPAFGPFRSSQSEYASAKS